MDNPPDLVHLFSVNFDGFWRWIIHLKCEKGQWFIFFIRPTDPSPKSEGNAVDAKQKKGMALITYWNIAQKIMFT